MDTAPLDDLFARLEAAKSRKEIRACLNEVIEKPARGANAMRHTFVKNLAQPHINGTRAQFASEFPTHGVRFKKIWDALE